MPAPQYEITPLFPLETSEGTYNTIKQQDQIEAVKFNIKNILLTNPGEKLSDPSFGVGLRGYLFELETSGDISGLKQNIINQIQKYANFFTKLNVIVDISRIHSNTLAVRVEFEFGIKKLNDYLEVTVSM
jgi:phage baseplate assembly protein W